MQSIVRKSVIPFIASGIVLNSIHLRVFALTLYALIFCNIIAKADASFQKRHISKLFSVVHFATKINIQNESLSEENGKLK